MTIRKGSKVKIVSENNNYDDFRNKTLRVIEVYKNDKEHCGYDMSMFPEKLLGLADLEGNIIPFSLYEYEIKRV